MSARVGSRVTVSRRTTIWCGFAIAAVIAAALLASTIRPGQAGPDVTRSAQLSDVVGHEADSAVGAAGLPAGFARTRDGALAAGLVYTATVSQRVLYFDDEQTAAALESIAANAARDTFVADTVRQLEAARAPLSAGSGTAWWLVRPLAWKVEAYTPDRARIAVWLVRVLARPGVVVPQSSWVTETVEVVWERGDWRLWSTVTQPGPTPILDGSDLAESAAEFDAALLDYTPVDAAGAGR